MISSSRFKEQAKRIDTKGALIHGGIALSMLALAGYEAFGNQAWSSHYQLFNALHGQYLPSGDVSTLVLTNNHSTNDVLQVAQQHGTDYAIGVTAGATSIVNALRIPFIDLKSHSETERKSINTTINIGLILGYLGFLTIISAISLPHSISNYNATNDGSQPIFDYSNRQPHFTGNSYMFLLNTTPSKLLEAGARVGYDKTAIITGIAGATISSAGLVTPKITTMLEKRRKPRQFGYSSIRH